MTPNVFNNIINNVGVDDAEGTPVPIPNTVVKLGGAENTWLATAREDKETPTFLFLKNKLTNNNFYNIINNVGVDDAEGTPVPIPNTVVKLGGAENTWLATAWEDKETPTFFIF